MGYDLCEDHKARSKTTSALGADLGELGRPVGLAALRCGRGGRRVAVESFGLGSLLRATGEQEAFDVHSGAGEIEAADEPVVASDVKANGVADTMDQFDQGMKGNDVGSGVLELRRRGRKGDQEIIEKFVTGFGTESGGGGHVVL